MGKKRKVDQDEDYIPGKAEQKIASKKRSPKKKSEPKKSTKPEAKARKSQKSGQKKKKRQSKKLTGRWSWYIDDVESEDDAEDEKEMGDLLDSGYFSTMEMKERVEFMCEALPSFPTEAAGLVVDYLSVLEWDIHSKHPKMHVKRDKDDYKCITSPRKDASKKTYSIRSLPLRRSFSAVNTDASGVDHKASFSVRLDNLSGANLNVGVCGSDFGCTQKYAVIGDTRDSFAYYNNAGKHHNNRWEKYGKKTTIGRCGHGGDRFRGTFHHLLRQWRVTRCGLRKCRVA